MDTNSIDSLVTVEPGSFPCRTFRADVKWRFIGPTITVVARWPTGGAAEQRHARALVYDLAAEIERRLAAELERRDTDELHPDWGTVRVEPHLTRVVLELSDDEDPMFGHQFIARLMEDFELT